MFLDPAFAVIEAPVNSNVWKVLVEEGDVLQPGQIVSIMEAMKMEINVLADPHLAGATVVKVIVKPGDAIESGKPVIIAKPSKS
jgi:urea carboxylase